MMRHAISIMMLILAAVGLSTAGSGQSGQPAGPRPKAGNDNRLATLAKPANTG